MFAIFKREIKGYFTGVMGYVFLVMFLAVAGIAFCATTLFAMSSNVTTYFTIMMLMSAIMLPILTMKSFSEEKKGKTEQLLLTSPVSITAMVMGKFLASYAIFAAATVFTTLYFLLLLPYAVLHVALLLGNMLALLMVGLVFIAIGIFVSSLTENQLTAAIGTIGILLALLIVAMVNSLIDSYVVRSVLSWLSVYSRYANFTYGIFDFGAVVYYISICVVFLFLSVRVFEKRRWS